MTLRQQASLRYLALGLALLLFAVALRWASRPLAGVARAWSPLELSNHERAACLLALHVVGMILLTVAALGSRSEAAVPICAFWSTTGALLECAQHPRVAAAMLGFLPADSAGSARGWLSESIAIYLVNGQFSAHELVATFLGGVLGFLCVRFLGARERGSVRTGEQS